MIYDAVIFDIDGTLWKASAASARGWNLALESLGRPERVTAAQIESVSGNPFAMCLDILLPGLKEQIPPLTFVVNEEETRAVTTDGGEFYAGVIDGIKSLARESRIFLVSNCQQWYLELMLGFSGLGPAISGFDCHGMSGLPKSEMLLRLKSRYRLQNPVYIGDTAKDEQAAALAGFPFIHAAWGFGKPQGRPRSAASFADLPGILAGRQEGKEPAETMHDKAGRDKLSSGGAVSDNPSREELLAVLTGCRTIAVVGLSDQTDRASYRVASYLKNAGYRIIPVNPAQSEILGEKCYPDLAAIPEPVDIVDIFRAQEAIPGIVEEAVRIKAGVVWMQEGLAHSAAARKARQAGLCVVQNRCLKVEHKKLFG